MNQHRFTLTVYVAPILTAESSVGHMWISLDDHQVGLKESYGFHPAQAKSLYGEGQVRTDDLQYYKTINGS